MKFRLSFVLVSFLLSCWGCDYARMRDQESVRTYEAKLPEMPEGSIPIAQGTAIYKSGEPSELKNPLPVNADTLERGRTAYGYFCIICHGQRLDGNGTVGQSFSPLPADLKSADVLDQSNGELFQKISFGFLRHPPLNETVPPEDRWAIIHYIRVVKIPGQQRNDSGQTANGP
jgi:hypothetical protein